MKKSVANDRLFFEALVDSEAFGKLKTHFDSFLPNRVEWWVTGSTKNSSGPKAGLSRKWDPASGTFSHKFALSRRLFSALKRKSGDDKCFSILSPSGAFHFCVPILWGERALGHLGIGELSEEDWLSDKLLDLLARQMSLAVELCQKNEELKKLSASIRPRAIALSTVHTVHRIINSTLNLDELVSRLAHLTAQVLRAGRCTIYLAEKDISGSVSSTNGKKPLRRKFREEIVCKAKVGYPKHQSKQFLRIPFGSGIEGGVARSAKIILRKKFIVVPLIDEDVIGVMRVSHKKEGKEFTYFDQEILTTLAEEAVIAIKNAQLYEEQKKVTLGTIQSLAVILGTRVDNVVAPEIFLRIALKVAEELHLTDEESQALHYAALLKDTARIGIPDDILKKPTKLTGKEYRLLREHPMKGAKIVQHFESLRPVVPIILYSREKFDGTGYPKGLKGEKIPIGARILCLINAFEAIIIGRPYRDRSTFEEALEEISKNSGTQFDPKVVEVFLKVIKREGFKDFPRGNSRRAASKA